MKPLIAISDIHYHPYKAHSHIMPNGMNSRLHQILETVDTIIDKAVEIDAEAILIAGDLFHVRGQVKPSVLNTVVKQICRAIFEGISVVIIPGNHDMEDWLGENTAVDFLSEIADTDPDVGGCYVLKDCPVHIGEWSIYGIPYCSKTDDFLKKFNHAKKGNYDVIMIHQGIDTFKPNEGIPDSGITAKDLDCKSWVIAGHYHNPFISNKVIQCGAPIHHNFGDAGRDSGYWVIKNEEEAEFHKLDNLRFAYFCEEAIPHVDEYGGLDNCIVKVQADSMAKAKELKEWVEKNYKPEVVLLDIQKEFKKSRKKTIKMSTPEKMIQEYIKSDKELKPHLKELLRVYSELDEEVA
jgi:DNA repair exonuclease SbcCD nuclease subunit